MQDNRGSAEYLALCIHGFAQAARKKTIKGGGQRENSNISLEKKLLEPELYILNVFSTSCHASNFHGFLYFE